MDFFPDDSVRASSSGGDGALAPAESIDVNELLPAAQKLRIEKRPANETQIAIHTGEETTRSFFISDDGLFRRTIEYLGGQVATDAVNQMHFFATSDNSVRAPDHHSLDVTRFS